VVGRGEDIDSLQRRSRAQKDTDEPSRWNAAGLVIRRDTLRQVKAAVRAEIDSVFLFSALD